MRIFLKTRKMINPLCRMFKKFEIPSNIRSRLLSKLSFFFVLGFLSLFLHFIAFLSVFTFLSFQETLTICLSIVLMIVFSFLLYKPKLQNFFNGDLRILLITAVFFVFHFYSMMFVWSCNLNVFYFILNSLMLLWCSLKTLTKPLSKMLLIVSTLLFFSLKLPFSKHDLSELFLCFSFLILILLKKKLTSHEPEPMKKKSSPNDETVLMSAIQEAVVLFDTELKIQFYNPFLCKLLGILDENASKLEVESKVLSLQQDEKYKQMKGLSFQSDEEMLQLLKAFKMKMAIFSGSASEDESNFTSFSTKKTFLSNLKKSVLYSKESFKSRVCNTKHSNIHESIRLHDCVPIKNKYNAVHYLNRNGNFYKKTKGSQNKPKKTFADILHRYSSRKNSSKHKNEYHFYAKAFEENKILLINFAIINDKVLVVIKPLNRKDPILNVFENSLSQNEMFASICHELRTPLNSITNMLELMEGSDMEPNSMGFLNPQKEYLANAILNSKLLLNNINDFLDFFSITSKIYVPKLDCFDLKKVLFECESIFRVFSKKRLISFFLDFDNNHTYLCYNDENRVKQIIINLLNNAFKFTNSTGSIVLELKNKPFVYEVIVRDTGAGIDPINFNKLANFQANMINHNSQILGGFGLTISNHIANYIGPCDEGGENKLYRGIKVKSEKDKGCRFSFMIEKNISEDESVFFTNPDSLDVKRTNIDHFKYTHSNHTFNFLADNYEVHESLNFEQLCKSNCRKILAVDDNEFNLFVLCEQFKKKNIELDTTNSGVDAVEMVKGFFSDPMTKFCSFCKFYKLIIMDIDMPIKNGFETTKEILEILKKHNLTTNVVSLSAFTQKQLEEKENLTETGILEFIEKPFNQEKMESLIQKYL